MATRIRGALGLRPASPAEGGRPPLPRELLLVTGLFLVYKFGRLLANGHESRAFRNADLVWDAERALRLPGEGAVQQLLLHGEPLIRTANTYYAVVHFPATIAFLAWLYWRHPAPYVWSRRVLALVTGAALALHILIPLAPPRLLAASGLVDTARVYGPSVYGAVPETDSMANQFAAMPSLHFGWALMVAIGLIAATRSPLRWWWLLHPAITLLVIVGTANHYWLDAVAAAVLLGFALLVVPSPGRPAAAPGAPADAPPPLPRREPAARTGTGTGTAGTGAVEAAVVPAGARR
ncbi:phosphatase PAP2 family protein [Streptomyces roseolus]|uniref:phosphatase PAP2 family protein n=1 Tax=Streptomyces roseolus TaxID=67358 RepID=UPI0033EF889A